MIIDILSFSFSWNKVNGRILYEMLISSRDFYFLFASISSGRVEIP